MRTMIAFCVAPIAVPLIAAVYLASTSPPGDNLSAFVVVVSALVAYAGTFLLGVPLYLFLRSQNASAFLIAPVFGFVAGALVMFVMLGRDMSSGTLLFGCLSGAAVGAILWLIARPDLRTP